MTWSTCEARWLARCWRWLINHIKGHRQLLIGWLISCQSNVRLSLMWPRVPPKATFCLRKPNNKSGREESKRSKLREKFLFEEATMPQIPNSSTDDYGADDEVKEYKQEDDANSESGAAVDLVNDLKSDLIKKEAENLEVCNCLWASIVIL